MLTRPGSRGNEISPRLPEAITERSGSSPSASSSPWAGSSSSRRPRAPRAARAAIPSSRAISVRPGAEVGDRVVLAPGLHVHVLRGAERAHEVLEGQAVALQERRALRLAVVGEHDQAVGARRVGQRRVHARDLAVHLGQHRQRVGALDAGMVGHLVVGQERGVDHRPAGHQVAHHRRHLQVALDHGAEGAHQGVLARAVDARLHVAAALAGLGVALARHLGHHERERLRHRVRTREVGRVVPSDGTATTAAPCSS